MVNPVLVELTRGGVVESVHRGAIAVCDPAGRVVKCLGAIAAPVFARSSLKPFQALPLVASGAADAFGVTDAELALACASHSSEPGHVEAVRAWLARIGAGDADLVCGPHWPRHEPAMQAMLRAGEKPARVHNNCSGKHTGFLTLARHLQAPLAGYERPDHAVQRAVFAAVEALCGVDPVTGPMGSDGCAAPIPAFPLVALARGMARFAESAEAGDYAGAAGRIVRAMAAHGWMVAGTGRSCTDLMAELGGAIVKTGAEGVFVAALPAEGLGIALKIDDGATRAAETAIVTVLSALGALGAGSVAARRHGPGPLHNYRGDVVGERRAAPDLAAF